MHVFAKVFLGKQINANSLHRYFMYIMEFMYTHIIHIIYTYMRPLPLHIYVKFTHIFHTCILYMKLIEHAHTHTSIAISCNLLHSSQGHCLFPGGDKAKTSKKRPLRSVLAPVPGDDFHLAMDQYFTSNNGG